MRFKALIYPDEIVVALAEQRGYDPAAGESPLDRVDPEIEGLEEVELFETFAEAAFWAEGNLGRDYFAHAEIVEMDENGDMKKRWEVNEDDTPAYDEPIEVVEEID